MRDVADPDPAPNEVVVAVEAAGICRSDVHYRSGSPTTSYLPMTLGHEVAGTIRAVGNDVKAARVGERVALHYQTYCGHCRFCVGGHEQLCSDGEMIGRSRPGGYAEQIAIPAVNAYVVPDSVPLDQAAVMMCSTATAFHALRKGRLADGETVAVLGVGGLGMSAVQLAKIMGAGRVLAVDIDRDKLAMAQAYGAIPVNGDTDDLAGALRDHGGVDVALDLLGSTELIRGGLKALHRLGRVVVVGIVHGDLMVQPFSDLIVGEREIIGCSDHLGTEIEELLALAADRKIDVASVITDRVGLDGGEVNAAMDRIERFGGGVRTVILP